MTPRRALIGYENGEQRELGIEPRLTFEDILE